jgi:integrase/recombinase XerC
MSLTISGLVSKYLAWCVKHRSPRTVEWYSGHLHGFLEHIDGELPAASLKPFHVVEWVDSHETWGDNYRRGAITAVQRACNWAEELGYLESSPIKKIKKPTAKRREEHMTAEDFQAVLRLLRHNDPFRDLFVFVWHSGCRPQEVRHIEPRHVDLERERIVFPAEESKGKRSKRVIYMQGAALIIVTRLMKQRKDDGKLFRNSRGKSWTKFAICNRFHRLSEKMGKRLFLYAARHGFAQRKLVAGHDHLTVACLLGHTDGSMLAKVYSHLDQDSDHLKRALRE